MKMNSLDISGKIDSITLEILGSVAEVAALLQIPFFVVGATARDVIMEAVYEVFQARATMDIDIAVLVEDWNKYTGLSEELIDLKQFTKGKDAQRFYYQEKFPVDIIPFGEISEPQHSISWPKTHGIEMSTLGFQEAYANAITVKLRPYPPLDIKFATPCGLVAMKIISWADRKSERAGDAKDLELILRKYIDAGNMERVYDGDEMDLLEIEDFDYEYMSARLLGRDLSLILSKETKERILEILDQETGEQTRYHLIEDMLIGTTTHPDDFENRLRLLEELKKGLAER